MLSAFAPPIALQKSLWRRSRIKMRNKSNRSERILESTLRMTPDFESILHARMGKIVLQHNLPKSDRIDASQRTNAKYHERTSEMVRPGSMNELGTSSAEIIHRLHFVSTELADEAYAPRSARHWRVQGSSPCQRRPDRHA